MQRSSGGAAFSSVCMHGMTPQISKQTALSQSLKRVVLKLTCFAVMTAGRADLVDLRASER
jgi:hypothetical protein